MNEYYEAFKKNLDQKMREKGFTIDGLAKGTGLPNSTVWRILKGKTSPKLKTVVMLARCLNVELGDLFKEPVGETKKPPVFSPDDKHFGSHIVLDPESRHVQPILKGTQVTLRAVLACVACGATVDQILESFPTLSREAVNDVIRYATATAQEHLRGSDPPKAPSQAIA